MRAAAALVRATEKQLLAPAAQASAAAAQRSPWHSPVPYLFGGLAAMLGLIAFALLILACSYWRLSRADPTHEEGDDEERRGSGDGKGDGFGKPTSAPVFEDKIVVIMAGDNKPTFLATPAAVVLTNGDPFRCTCKDEERENAAALVDDKPKHDEDNNSHHHQSST